jgi:glycosyltransferase involved in cell wall biosynthesis
MENKQKIRILFISHTYPPIVGGVETQNFELSTWLGKISDLTLVANRNRKMIPLFLPYSLTRAVLTARNYDVIVLGSCLLGIVGWFVKKITKKPVVAVAHGLDLTWKNSLYQKSWVGVFIPSLDKLIAVGNETIQVGVERGIPKEKFVFIPNGVHAEKLMGNYTKADLRKIVGMDFALKRTVLTSGRLARRKGVAWFIENVLPKLAEDIVYVVAGSGPDKENIQAAISKNKMESRVKMLGYVPDDQRNVLMNTCDVFVQPNIKIEGDMEGFGISVIEAVSCKIPVIAAKLEGLQDAIKDGENGFLVESANAQAWTKKVAEVLASEDFRREFGAKACHYVIENYSWDKIAQKYLEEIESVISKSKIQNPKQIRN